MGRFGPLGWATMIVPGFVIGFVGAQLGAPLWATLLLCVVYGLAVAAYYRE